jgi:hypothetical protein
MANNDRWYSSPTQRFWVCQALIEGRVISTRTEIREVKGWRLAAIVETLKSKYGWPIKSELRGKENVAHYFLPPGTDPATLNYPPSAKSLADGVQK